MTQKDNPKYIKAWTFYDWANSVYSLVITSAVFPVYYGEITRAGKPDAILFNGLQPETVFDLSLAISFLIVALSSPILSSIADATGDKLKFMKIFCYTGGLACIGLAFMTSETLIWGLICNIVASVGFWGSQVFYNAYLPEIASEERMDAVSAQGFIKGYLGSVLLLVICLILIQVVAPESQKALYTQISFVLTGLWWIGFAQYTFANLPKSETRISQKLNILENARRELLTVLSEVRKEKNLKTFLFSFFFYSLAMQTIFLMAALFGKSELDMEVSKLILTILLIQIEAILGAWLFQWSSQKLGNQITLLIGIGIWVVICIMGYLLDKSNPNVEIHFYSIAGLVGLVMGGIQALSRSTYSKLLPETEDTTTFFSFYDVFEKFALFFGLVIYGIMIEQGGMKSAVLSMGISFAIAFIIMMRLKSSKLRPI